jgi:ABC-type uncharacterized transport system YnjBCD permease subunit
MQKHMQSRPCLLLPFASQVALARGSDSVVVVLTLAADRRFRLLRRFLRLLRLPLLLAARRLLSGCLLLRRIGRRFHRCWLLVLLLVWPTRRCVVHSSGLITPRRLLPPLRVGVLLSCWRQ